MMKTYPALWNQNRVGEVTLCQEGLYYRFRCRAQLPKEDIYRLQLGYNDVWLDCGVFIPKNNQFEVDKKFPSKQFPDDDFRFRIVTKKENEKFIPIYEDMPFEALAKVHLGKFAVRNGVAGMIFP